MLGIGLNSVGEVDRALSVLASALERHPYDRDLLTALVTLHRDGGDRAAALRHAERLRQLAPDDPEVAQLIQALRRPRE